MVVNLRTAVTIDGASLTPEAVAAIARRGARVELAPEARERNDHARRALAALLARGEQIYGATSGVGALREHQVDADQREDYSLRLLRSHACGAGAVLWSESVRAAMATRANQLGAGGAGVADELLDALVACLNADLSPFTRGLGSLGTGDLTSLADIALALLGEGQMWHGDELVDAGAALSFEAAAADPVALDPRIHSPAHRPGQSAIAARMRELLSGLDHRSRARSHDRAPGLSAIQDPYPFRALPQVDGAVHDALSALGETVGHELNFAGENALIVAGDHDPVALPNGNPHAAPLANAIDNVRTALRVLIATELVVAVRALRIAGTQPVGAGARAVYDAAAPHLDHDLSDRPLHPDIEAARVLIESWG